MISIRKLMNSFSYAGEGLRIVFKNDQNIRIHFIVAFLVFLLGIYLQLNATELGVIVAMIVLVLSAEMINTVIEEMVDLITTEHREQAKIAKDVSSAMVLITSVGSVIVGGIVFLPHLLLLFS